MSLLMMENVSVEYTRRGKTVQAVKDFSLSLEPGETVGLVGESGSGKSTVALALLRLIRPQEGRITAGRIIFDGKDLLSLPEQEMRRIRGGAITMIFQDPFTSLNPVMTIAEQMEEALVAHGRNEDLGQALTKVQLDGSLILRRYPHQLSGGQRQRVCIAMALLNKPKVLLADEPTTALDVLVQKEILDLLFRLQRELGMAVLFITHNLALAAQRAHQLMVMKEGQKVEAGLTGEVMRHPQQPYTRQLMAAMTDVGGARQEKPAPNKPPS